MKMLKGENIPTIFIIGLILTMIMLGAGGLSIIFYLFLISLYCLPTIIAFNKNKKQKLGICTLNLFLGWTFLGWIISLIWAVCKD